MSSRDVGVDPVSEVYRRRVRFEWMAVGVIAVGAAMVVASWTPLPVVSAIKKFPIGRGVAIT